MTLHATQVNDAPGPPRIPDSDVVAEIVRLDWRDMQLWLIGLVVMGTVSAGFLVLVSPQLLSQIEVDVFAREGTAGLVFGLVTLLLLLNLYLLHQRKVLVKGRRNLIIQLREAEQSARTDALTGLYNRRLMEEVLAKEVAHAGRKNSPLCVAIVDVNGFKEFNTRFGHLTGDQVLADVARLLQRNFRAADTVARYGGDEFLIVMPETNLSQAQIATERLHEMVRRWNDNSDRNYEIGLSCGMSMYSYPMTIIELIKAADADLYVKKAESYARKAEPVHEASAEPKSWVVATE